MLEISYGQVLAAVTALWVLVRSAAALRRGRIDWKRECLLLTVYACIAVIARLVYFHLGHVDGRIAPLRFDPDRILPLWVTLKPLNFLRDRYDGWQMNLIGNIAMFVPVGIFLPLCFRKLDRVWKVTLAGFGWSLLIELSQLLFYERNSDVDDLILNTAGAFLGALLFFGIRALVRRGRRDAA